MLCSLRIYAQSEGSPVKLRRNCHYRNRVFARKSEYSLLAFGDRCFGRNIFGLRKVQPFNKVFSLWRCA